MAPSSLREPQLKNDEGATAQTAQRHPDRMAVDNNNNNRIVYILEFKRTKDLRPNYLEAQYSTVSFSYFLVPFCSLWLGVYASPKRTLPNPIAGVLSPSSASTPRAEQQLNSCFGLHTHIL